MGRQELKKLSRSDLLELLVMQSRELDRLRSELDRANRELEQRRLQIEEAGSIAEAAMSLSGVFEDAQHAADQYLVNVRQITQQEEARASRLEAETRRKCEEMTAQAKRETEEYWALASGRFRAFYLAHPEMRHYLSGEEAEQILGEPDEKT